MRQTRLPFLLPLMGLCLAGGCGETTGVTPFVWGVAPGLVEVAAGGEAHVQVRVKSKNNINHDVALSTRDVPTGMLVTIPAKMTSTQETADVTISAPLGFAEGTYTFEILAVELGGDPTAPHEEVVTVIVTDDGGVPDFALAVTPNPATPEVDAVTNFDYSVTALNGFVGTVTLTLTGLPDDLTYAVGLTPFTFTFVEGGPQAGMGHFRLVYHPVGPVSSPALLQLSASSDQTIHTETITVNLLAP